MSDTAYHTTCPVCDKDLDFGEVVNEQGLGDYKTEDECLHCEGERMVYIDHHVYVEAVRIEDDKPVGRRATSR